MPSTKITRFGRIPAEGIKAPVVVETTANITLSGQQTVNSVAVVAGDRVLVKDQTVTTENGIYDVSVNAWTRSPDLSNSDDHYDGLLVGTEAGNLYRMNGPDPQWIPGTNSLTFTTVLALPGLAWGVISGTLSDQTDLQTALDGKAASSHTHVEADITDLDKYTQAAADALLAGKAATSHTHATSDVTSGTFADARIAESNVTQHQAALTITQSQISDAPNRPVMRNYIDGFTLSNDAIDTAHDILIQPGLCSNDLNDDFIELTTAITKRIDANWTAGDDAGGFPSGLTLSASTWYRVFVIYDEGGDVVDAGFDTSATAANLLSDASAYEHYRQVGWVLTDGSSNILGFTMYSNGQVVWDASVVDQNNTAPGTSAVSITMSVPPSEGVIAHFNAVLSHGSTARILYSALSANDVAPSSTVVSISVSAASTIGTSEFSIPVNSSGQIRARCDVGTGLSANVARTWGYTDPRGTA